MLRVVLDHGSEGLLTLPFTGHLTVADVVEHAASTLGFTRNSLGLFSLCVRHLDPKIVPLLEPDEVEWLHKPCVLTQAHFMAGEDNRLHLKMRCPPANITRFVRQDPKAARYYQKQLHHHLKDQGSTLPPFEDTIKLAMVEAADHLSEDLLRRRQDPTKSDHTKMFQFLLKHIGLELFVPSALLSQTDRSSLQKAAQAAFAAVWPLSQMDRVQQYLEAAFRSPDFGEVKYSGYLTTRENAATQGVFQVKANGRMAFVMRGRSVLEFGAEVLTSIMLNGSLVSLHIAGVTYKQNTILACSRRLSVNIVTLLEAHCYSAGKVGVLQIDPRDSVEYGISYDELSRAEAEDILQRVGPVDGLFLLRRSREPGHYGLSVCQNHQIVHFKISKFPSRQGGFKYGIQDGLRYVTVQELLEHYNEDADGLPCRIQQNVIAIDDSKHASDALATQVDLPAMPTGRMTSAAIDKTKTLKHLTGTLDRGLSLSDIEIPRDALILGQELGHGEFGTVQLGTWYTGDRKVQVAIKVLKSIPGSVGEEQAAALREEAMVMKPLKHPNVVRLLGVCSDAPVMMVTELVPLGALNKYLRRQKASLDSIILLTFMKQIADGMGYLSSLNFVHRDLAARNILVASDTLVKISDFGLSRSMAQDKDYYQAAQRGKWPIKWYAPESIGYSRFTSKSDVWSYGVTAWEVLTCGKKPYKGLMGRQVVELVNSGGRLPHPGKFCPDLMYSTMMQCWQHEPEKRPAFEILSAEVNSILDSVKRGSMSAHTSQEQLYDSFLKTQSYYDVEPVKEEVEADEEEEGAEEAVVVDVKPNLDAKNISFGSPLGIGSFGTMSQGQLRRRDGSQNVAIKSVFAQTSERKQLIVQLSDTLRRLMHPHLVTTFGVALHRNQALLVTELAMHGALDQFMRRTQGGGATFLLFAKQIADAMEFLERNRFVHGALAARNVLVMSPRMCKVSDAGLARTLDKDQAYYRGPQGGKWPLKWCAPECVLRNQFTHKSDVWSFGVVLWEIVTNGGSPHQGLDGRQVMTKTSRNGRLQAPAGTPAWCAKLMAACWLDAPEQRPDFKTVQSQCEANIQS